MYYYFDPTWFWLLPGIILSAVASILVNRTFAKYSDVRASSGATAAQVSASMLRDAGLSDVQVLPVSGNLTDNYNPQKRTLNLSQPVYNSDSISALGVAAHEAGHALQDATNYAPLKLRSAMVPVTTLTSNAAVPLFLVGLLFSWQPLVNIGIICFAVAVVFSLVTLPVEFNASSRALAALESGGFLTREENAQAKKVLQAAALTYVASALTAILQLVRLLALSGNNRRRN